MSYSYSAYIIVDVTLFEIVSGCTVAVVLLLCGGTNVERSAIGQSSKGRCKALSCDLTSKLGAVPCDTDNKDYSLAHINNDLEKSRSRRDESSSRLLPLSHLKQN
jgi:hypothetical protein